MTGIKELPLWARILIGDKTLDSGNTRNSDHEDDIAREVAEISAECDKPLPIEPPPTRILKCERRWVPSLTLCGEA